MMKFKLHIDQKSYGKKPDGNEIGWIKTRLQKNTLPSLVTLEEVAEKISRGHSISPAVMSGMLANDWKEQQLFLIDVDNEYNEILARKKGCSVEELQSNEKIPILSIENALNICKDHNLPVAFYYHTFNSSFGKPKFRLGFIMDKPVKTNDERRIIMNVLISLFPQSDKSCINADRVFFGTNSKAVISDANARITLENIYNGFPQPEIKNTNIEKNSQAEMIDSELEDLKRCFNFFEYLKKRNGEYKKIDKGAVFKNCEICGHHDDLVYYDNTNTFYCFSSSGEVGGSIIDYLIHAEKITLQKAIEKFKYELCKLEKPYNVRLLELFQKIKPEQNCSYNDKDYSKLFSKVYKNRCRFNTTANEWFVYNGQVWVKDDIGMKVRQYAKAFVNTLLAYAPYIKDEQRKKSFLEYVLKLNQHKFRETLIRDARDNYYITNNDLDTNLNILNCLNGTLDLSTFELKEHNPNDLLSKLVNVEYKPQITSTLFKKFIREIMKNDTKKIEYLQKIFGYALTAETNMEACFIFYGATTRNGKSTLMETISYMLGNSNGYAMTIQPLSLAQKTNRDSRQASGDIARLKSCRFVSVSEFPQKMILDVALLKQGS